MLLDRLHCTAEQLLQFAAAAVDVVALVIIAAAAAVAMCVAIVVGVGVAVAAAASAERIRFRCGTYVHTFAALLTGSGDTIITKAGICCS